MSQNLIVAAIVLGAALWAVWYWMPAAGRRAMAAALAHAAQRMGLRARAAERLATAVGDAPGCGSCESCGSCASPGAANKSSTGGNTMPEEKPVAFVRRL